MTEKRTLPADVYDALELSALAFGGIGRGAYLDWDFDGDDAKAPRCILGHAAWLVDDLRVMSDGEVCSVLYEQLGNAESVNDTAVRSINWRRGRDGDRRVSFKAWCKELNVERGA